MPRSSSRTSSRRASRCCTGRAGSASRRSLLAAVARELRELPEEPLVVGVLELGQRPRCGARGDASPTGGDRGRRAGRDGRARAGRPRRLPDPRPGRGVLHVPRRHGRVRDGTRRDRQPPIAGERAPLASRGHARDGSIGSRRDIPALFANVLRLDRLDRAAGRAAIVRPARSLERARGGRGRRGGGARRARPRRRRRGPHRARHGRGRCRRAQRSARGHRGAVPPARHAAPLGRRARRGLFDAAG